MNEASKTTENFSFFKLSLSFFFVLGSNPFLLLSQFRLFFYSVLDRYSLPASFALQFVSSSRIRFDFISFILLLLIWDCFTSFLILDELLWWTRKENLLQIYTESNLEWIGWFMTCDVYDCWTQNSWLWWTYENCGLWILVDGFDGWFVLLRELLWWIECCYGLDFGLDEGWRICAWWIMAENCYVVWACKWRIQKEKEWYSNVRFDLL